MGDESVEIGIGEHLTRAFRAVADDDVTERTRSDVTVERLDRATELGSGLRGSFEPVRWGLARFARGFGRQAPAGNLSEALAAQRLVILTPKYLKGTFQILC